MEEEHAQTQQEKEDLETEILSHTSHTTMESELTSRKRMNRELQARIEELEEELDEANVKSVPLVVQYTYVSKLSFVSNLL